MEAVDNARDAIVGSGTVRVETSEHVLLPDDLRGSDDVSPGPYVRLLFRDDGVGMPEEVREHVFEPFFTTRPFGSGTGLGLATVYGIVKQHGGHVTVQSAPGAGAEFALYFPSVVVEQPASATSGPSSVPRGGTGTVLLVEDEPAVLSLTKRMLERLGHRVIAACSPAEALAAAAESEGPIELLLTDVIMPGMSGRDLARRLAERGVTNRVVYMSGYTADIITSQGVLEPGTRFLAKPFSLSQLGRALREADDGDDGRRAV